MNEAIFRSAHESLPAVFKSARPVAALLLGSGWNHAVDGLSVVAEVPYSDIPGFGAATVIGHSGRLLLARTPKGADVIVFCGRRHWYEGCEWEPVVMPAMLAKLLGAPIFLVTNAAGGIRETLAPGDMVILRDHIRLSPLTPLRGEHNPFFGPRFPDQSRVYDPELIETLHRAGLRQGLDLTTGVYMLSCGPAFETPAEIRAYGILGADLTGMSTVPEAMVATAVGLRVAGVSFVSNMAAGVTGKLLDGNDVIDCAAQHADKLSRLVLDFLEEL